MRFPFSSRSNEQISCDGNISRGSESDLNSASNSAGRYAGDTVGTGGGGDFGAVDPSQAGWTGGLMSWAGGVLKAGAAYLPHQVSEVFSQDRAFAFAHIPLSTSSPLYPQPVSAHVGAGRQPVDVPDTHYVANGEGPPTGSVIGLKKVAAITWLVYPSHIHLHFSPYRCSQTKKTRMVTLSHKYGKL